MSKVQDSSVSQTQPRTRTAASTWASLEKKFSLNSAIFLVPGALAVAQAMASSKSISPSPLVSAASNSAAGTSVSWMAKQTSDIASAWLIAPLPSSSHAHIMICVMASTMLTSSSFRTVSISCSCMASRAVATSCPSSSPSLDESM